MGRRRSRGRGEVNVRNPVYQNQMTMAAVVRKSRIDW
jgi:hypothetical protein